MTNIHIVHNITFNVRAEESTSGHLSRGVSLEQMMGIIGQWDEIVKRVGNGSLDPVAVKRALQDIIEGKLPTLTWNPPTWWRTPEQQLERARQLCPNAVLPEPPEGFTPRTKSEVLLLHVPDSFDSLWDKAIAPTGYTKYRWEGVKADKRNLRLSPNKREYAEPVWLAFDPEHGKGERPDSFWGQADIAASEVFSALIQFPEWSLAWFAGSSAPNLTGYQLEYDGNWSHFPYLFRWGGGRQLRLCGLRAGNWSYVPCLYRWGHGRRLKLDGFCAARRLDYWSSPSVREC